MKIRDFRVFLKKKLKLRIVGEGLMGEVGFATKPLITNYIWVNQPKKLSMSKYKAV